MQTAKCKAQHANLRAAWAALALLAACAICQAATREWVAQAGDVVQIDSITVSGTWLAGETGSIVIGNSTLTVTAGSDTLTTAQMAQVIANAINAPEIGSSLVGSETRNAAGQKLGEFRDVEAVINPSNSSIVLVRSKVAGVPFYDVADVTAPYTLSVSDTSTSGALAAASVQVATGKNWWNNAKNWSGGAVPANNDSVVLANSAVSIQYALPNGALEVIFEQYNSFTGTIGLPITNRNGYAEYRQRYVRLDDAGTGTDIQHRFGLGPGAGSPLINLRHTLVKCTPVVYATGKPALTGTKALNIVCSQASSDLTVVDGSVDCSTQDSTTAGWNIQSFGPGANTDVRYLGPASGFAVAGGNVLLLNTSGTGTLTQWGGAVTVQNSSATWSDLKLRGPGTLLWDSTATISAISLGRGATFDARSRQGDFTITTSNVEGPCKIYDPYERITWTNAIAFNGVNFTEVHLELSANFSIKITN